MDVDTDVNVEKVVEVSAEDVDDENVADRNKKCVKVRMQKTLDLRWKFQSPSHPPPPHQQLSSVTVVEKCSC